MHRMVLSAALLLNFTLGLVTSLRAQEVYPSSRVRVIVPFPPGAQTDLIARLIADKLSQKWQQAFYVDNIVGAAGKLGTRTAERSKPDGYTLLVVPPSFVTNPFIYKDAGVDPSQWAAVSLIVTAPYLLVARPTFPGSTVNDLIEQARSKLNAVTFASSGVGSSAHLAGVELETMANVKMLHVPFRGAAPALTAVMSGEVDIVFDALVTTLPLWEAGKVKVLGLGTTVRSPAMPNVPTIAESGLPGFVAATWTAMVAPPSTPAAVVEKLSTGIKEVLKEPSVIERLHSLKLDIAGTSPAETATFLAQESARWGSIAKAGDVTADEQ